MNIKNIGELLNREILIYYSRKQRTILKTDFQIKRTTFISVGMAENKR